MATKTWGNYCGPAWTNGGVDNGSPPNTWDKAPIDWLDSLCKAHDSAYYYADLIYSETENKNYYWLAKIAADDQLNKGLISGMVSNAGDYLTAPLRFINAELTLATFVVLQNTNFINYALSTTPSLSPVSQAVAYSNAEGYVAVPSSNGRTSFVNNATGVTVSVTQNNGATTYAASTGNTFSIETNPIATGDFTATSITNVATGEINFQIQHSGTGEFIASGSNYIVNSNNTVTTTNGAAQVTTSLTTGRMLYQQDPNGSGFFVGANGNDIYFPAGSTVALSTNGSTVITSPIEGGGTLRTTVTNGVISQTVETIPQDDSLFTSVRDGAGNLVSINEIQNNPETDTRQETVTTFAHGTASTVVNTYDPASQLISSQPVAITPPALIALTGQQTTTALNDVAGLISAIQGGRPLPILNSGLRLANSLIANNPNQSLASTGQIVGGLASLYNLSNALQNGDSLTQINATLSTLNYVNSTLPSLLSSSAGATAATGAAAPLSEGLNTFLNGSTAAAGTVPGVLPVLGLVISIRNGDSLGIVSGLIGIVNPALLTTPVGWILAGASIVKALTDEPPESWGIGKFVTDSNGQLQIDVVGQGSGRSQVQTQLQGTRNYLQGLIAQAQQSAPNAALGIIAQRTASITWREARQNDAGYAINDIDPISAQKMLKAAHRKVESCNDARYSLLA